MTIKLREAVDILNASEQIGSMGGIPTDVSFVFSINQKRLRALNKRWHEEVRELQDKYCDKDKAGKIKHDNGVPLFKDLATQVKYQDLLNLINEEDVEVKLLTMSGKEFQEAMKAVPEAKRASIPSRLLEVLIDTVLIAE